MKNNKKETKLKFLPFSSSYMMRAREHVEETAIYVSLRQSIRVSKGFLGILEKQAGRPYAEFTIDCEIYKKLINVGCRATSGIFFFFIIELSWLLPSSLLFQCVQKSLSQNHQRMPESFAPFAVPGSI
jgi:hypothetical protein